MERKRRIAREPKRIKISPPPVEISGEKCIKISNCERLICGSLQITGRINGPINLKITRNLFTLLISQPQEAEIELANITKCQMPNEEFTILDIYLTDDLLEQIEQVFLMFGSTEAPLQNRPAERSILRFEIPPLKILETNILKELLGPRIEISFMPVSSTPPVKIDSIKMTYSFYESSASLIISPDEGIILLLKNSLEEKRIRVLSDKLSRCILYDNFSLLDFCTTSEGIDDITKQISKAKLPKSPEINNPNNTRIRIEFSQMLSPEEIVPLKEILGNKFEFRSISMSECPEKSFVLESLKIPSKDDKKSYEEPSDEKDEEELEFLGAFEKPPPNVIADITIDSDSDSSSEKESSNFNLKPDINAEKSNLLLPIVQSEEELKEMELKKRQVLELIQEKIRLESRNLQDETEPKTDPIKFEKNEPTPSTSSSSSQGTNEINANDLKCRKFLLLLIRMTRDNKKDRKSVRGLIQNLIDDSLTPGKFVEKLRAFNFRAHEELVPFLEENLSQLRRDLATGNFSIEGIQPPLFS